MPPRLVHLELADEPEAWRRAGFAVDDEGVCTVGQVVLRLTGAAAAEGGPIVGWGLADDDDGDGDLRRAVAGGSIDGLATQVTEELTAEVGSSHPNGVTRLDHVVVTTPDLARTLSALAAAGIEVRRTRDVPAGRGGVARQQAFCWLGEVILEVVGPASPNGGAPARFWGLAFTALDLDALATMLGDDLGTIRPAVQPGRRITTLRRNCGARTPVAFLSPHAARET